MKSLIVFFIGCTFLPIKAQQNKWYTQGNFYPVTRLEYHIKNDLNFERINCPVIIPRESFPLPDLHEMWVTVVDPSLPSQGPPSAELLKLQGGHQLLEESNGHAIYHQMDDLDKDGIWDEIFFMTSLKPKEIKTIYIYIGENIRGWNTHYTHANIGSYARHLMPFWESEHVGWKIWFANSVDVFAKRKAVLMSNELYMRNVDGYGISNINHDWGSDIQGVAGSFGGGAICLFEYPEKPDSVSCPRFTPTQHEIAPKSLFNAGQISDTRYAYDVIVNGPLRSMVKIKTMNWNSGAGQYELVQYYTAYAHQNYCTCKVIFTEFQPLNNKVVMGCGIRKKPAENNFIQKGGVIISSGPEGIRDPEKIDQRMEIIVDFIGSALVVKNQYLPEYQYVKGRDGNHTFRVKADNNHSFEFALFSGWSEGSVLNNAADFNNYVTAKSMEFNNPLNVDFIKIEKKLQGQ
jgi:hypothetical protein